MARAGIRIRRNKSGLAFQVRYRLGGRDAPLLAAGTYATLPEAEAARDKINLHLAGRELPPLTRAPRRGRARGDKVYVAALGDLVKIGISVDPERRARDLNGELLLVLEGGRQEEVRLHRRFAEYRVRGEWFQHKGLLRRWIKQQSAARVALTEAAG